MIFERIVCGVDGSPAGFEALRQATLLRSDEARVLAVTVCETDPGPPGGAAAGPLTAELCDRATITRDAAREHLRDVPLAEARIVDGSPAPSLLVALDRESATLLAVGTHGGGHRAEMLLGSVATAMLQQAPCSVLVARGSDDTAWSPDSIVVGMDGSREALVSAVIAAELGDRFGAAVRTIAAQGGPRVDRPVLREIDEVHWVSGHPVGALVDASREADLVIVGSRGLRAFEALGSVSERVAHQAHCSVLVVRPDRPQEEA
jgi:nucleotide-binding universal stress UspA family protein